MFRLNCLLSIGALALSLAAGAAQAADTSGPLDLAVANESRLMEMLRRSGRIGENASFTEAEQILRDYLKERAPAAVPGRAPCPPTRCK